MMKLVVVVAMLVSMVVASPRYRRAPKYDQDMDAGIRGEGDLYHHEGYYVGYDNVYGYLKLVEHSSNDTEWKFTSDNRWVHMADGKCVHPQGGAEDPDDNTFLTLVDCDPYNKKRIKFEGLADNDYWNIVHLSSGKCIHPLGGTARAGVRLVIYDDCGRNNQLDYIFKDADNNKMALYRK